MAVWSRLLTSFLGIMHAVGQQHSDRTALLFSQFRKKRNCGIQFCETSSQGNPENAGCVLHPTGENASMRQETPFQSLHENAALRRA